MGRLRPTSSNAKLEPAPSWDVEPTSLLPATATTDPLPPDSLATDPPQTDRTSSDPHEKTSTASPKSAITGGPYGLPEGHVDSHGAAAGPAVMFPPQEVGGHLPLPFAINESVPAHDKNITPEAEVVVAGLVAGPTGLQPGGPPVILIPFVGNPWMSGLFDCCQHPTNAIITTVAPCVTFGQIAEILDNGSTSCLTGSAIYFFMLLGVCHWNIGVQYRRRLRSAFKIAETPLSDSLSHIYCPFCSLCQEFRELKYHGLDPSQGYQGVIAGILYEQRQGADTIPPAGQEMMRCSEGERRASAS